MKYIGILTVALIVGLSGCASKPTAESMQKDLEKAAEAREKAEQKRTAKRQEKNEEFLSSIPNWALETPKPDSTGLYAVGSSESENLNVSQKKAMLDAEFGLAKIYKQEISGSERNFTQERNDKSLNSQYTALIDKLVARVPVVGFEVVKQDVKAMNGSFHSWVLLKLPYAQFNKVLQEMRAESMESTVREAFDDLDKRVKSRLEDKIKEQKAQQELRIGELTARSDIARKDVVAASAAASGNVSLSDTTVKQETNSKLENSSNTNSTSASVVVNPIPAPTIGATQ